MWKENIWKGGSRLGKATEDGATQEAHGKTMLYKLRTLILDILDKINPALILSDRSVTVMLWATLDWTLSFLTGSLLIAWPSHRAMISCSTTEAKRGRNTGQMEPGLKAGTWGSSFRTCNQSHAEFQQSASWAAQTQNSNIKMIDEVQNAWFSFLQEMYIIVAAEFLSSLLSRCLSQRSDSWYLYLYRIEPLLLQNCMILEQSTLQHSTKSRTMNCTIVKVKMEMAKQLLTNFQWPLRSGAVIKREQWSPRNEQELWF